MTRPRRACRHALLLTLGFTCAALFADARPLLAQEADSQYQTTVAQAVHEFSLSNWAEARALFRRAHALSPSARTFRGMGMAAFELKLYVDAQRELTAALQDTQRPLTDEQRTQVASLIEQARAFVGRYQVILEPATARPMVDGQEALFDPGNVLLLSLGDHVISARAEGYQEARVPLRVEGGESLALKIQLAPVGVAPTAVPALVPAAAPVAAPASAPAQPARQQDSGAMSTAAWVLLVSGAAIGGGAAIFWIVGGNQYSDLEKSCGVSGCSDAEVAASGVETSDLLTTVGLGLAGATLAASVVCFVLAGGDDGESASASLRIGPTGVNLRGSF